MDTQIITLSSGRGPAECCWVVSQVLKQILIEIRSMGYTYHIIDEQQGDLPGTYHSVSLSVAGNELIHLQKSWEGTIQWTGISMYRKHHKRKNWFVAVQFRKNTDLLSIDLNQLKFQTMRSGGKGGQHVNKVSTAVRVTHTPTGISVTSSTHRSQLQNKKLALQKLQLKLEERQLEEAGKQASRNWQEKIEIERGNPIRVFSSLQFKDSANKNNKQFGSRRQLLKQDLRTRLNETKDE